MEKVSLQSKSNSSLTHDPSNYPKDLDPFGEDDDNTQLGQTMPSHEVIKPSAPGDPSYPGTLDPFAEEEEDEGAKGKLNSEGVKTNNPNRSSKRVSTISNQEKDSNIISNTSNGGVSLETSITSRASDYDESLDPFGGDDETTTATTGKTKADDRKSIDDTSKELRKPAIILGEASGSGNRTATNDNFSIKSETESSSSGEIIKRGGEERRSYSNQNSPVPVPPRRKHRNVSPSTKSLNRASYSASSLDREPLNGISSPSSPDPNRLSTIEADSYLSHSTSNLSIRSTSPITTVRSSPIRSRKKRRAPDPPGFTPTVTPNTSLIATDQDTSIETTVGSINDTLNEPKNEATSETPCETTPEPRSESTTIIPDEVNDEPIKESNNETPIESNLEPEIEIEAENKNEIEEKNIESDKEEEKNIEMETEKSAESEIDHADESIGDQKLTSTTNEHATTTNTDEPITTNSNLPATSSEPTSEKTNEPESHTIAPSSTSNGSTADSIVKLDPDQIKSHQDTSNNL